MWERHAQTKGRTAFRYAVLLCCVGLLSACLSADQGSTDPPDPFAPFPLANSVIVGQPQPGTLLVEERDILVLQLHTRLAAEAWCDGPAYVTAIRFDDRGGAFGRQTVTWLVRCQ